MSPSTRIAPKAGDRTTAKAVGPARLLAALAPPAHLVEPDRRHRADEGEARHHRKHQRQQVAVEGHPHQQDADHRIEQRQEGDVAAAGGEVLDALAQDLAQVADGEVPNAGDLDRGPVAVADPAGDGPDVPPGGADLLRAPGQRISDGIGIATSRRASGCTRDPAGSSKARSARGPCHAAIIAEDRPRVPSQPPAGRRARPGHIAGEERLP